MGRERSRPARPLHPAPLLTRQHPGALATAPAAPSVQATRCDTVRAGSGGGDGGTRDSLAMTAALDDLVRLLDLEPIEVNIFRGRSPDERQQRVFGGQVAGQALVAAARTVSADRPVHSLHAYFLRPGDAVGAHPLRGRPHPRRPQLHHPPRRGHPARRGHLQPAGQLPRPRGRPRPPGADARRPPPRDPARLPAAHGAVPRRHRRVVPAAPAHRHPLRRGRPDGPPAQEGQHPAGVAARRRPAARRSRAPRLHRHLRVGHDAARHHACCPTASAGPTSRSRWPASTTPCGSTGPSAPTTGCSTTRSRRPASVRGGWPRARSSPKTASWSYP